MATRRKFGLLLIAWAAAVFFGFETWIATREPVFQTATIPAGTRTFMLEPFRVTYSSDYYLSIQSDEDGVPSMKARWALVCNGETRSSGLIGERSTWEWVPAPDASACQMKLDTIVAQGSTSVQLGEVGWRLEGIHRNIVFFCSAALLFGSAMLVRVPEAGSTRVLQPSLYGMLASLLLIPLVMIAALFVGAHKLSYGLWLKSPPRANGLDYGDQRWKPIVLGIDGESRLTLNGKAVSREQLPGVLRDVFRQRPEWTVKLEADHGLEVREVIRVLDLLEGMGIRALIG